MKFYRSIEDYAEAVASAVRAALPSHVKLPKAALAQAAQRELGAASSILRRKFDLAVGDMLLPKSKEDLTDSYSLRQAALDYRFDLDHFSNSRAVAYWLKYLRAEAVSALEFVRLAEAAAKHVASVAWRAGLPELATVREIVWFSVSEDSNVSCAVFNVSARRTIRAWIVIDECYAPAGIRLKPDKKDDIGYTYDSIPELEARDTLARLRTSIPISAAKITDAIRSNGHYSLEYGDMRALAPERETAAVMQMPGEKYWSLTRAQDALVCTMPLPAEFKYVRHVIYEIPAFHHPR